VRRFGELSDAAAGHAAPGGDVARAGDRCARPHPRVRARGLRYRSSNGFSSPKNLTPEVRVKPDLTDRSFGHPFCRTRVGVNSFVQGDLMMVRGVICAAAIACSCVVMSAGVARAQETVNYASLSGRVTDGQGGVVPGAEVRARNVETNVSAETTTDAMGRFRFPYLRASEYEVTAHLSGFRDVVRRVALTVGAAFDLPIELVPGGVTEAVTVSADAPVIEMARTQIAGTIGRTEIAALPVNGRNFLDLALLVPGVAPTNTGSTQLFAETSAVPGQGLSIGSQRNLSNNFLVDGLSANDDAAGLSGIPYSMDAVDQFQVITSGGQAELGRALGGYVNVITRSGTNTVEADTYEYLRDRRLNASNALTGSQLPMHQDQFGASAGGPLVRSRTFYFGNVERRQLDQSGLTTILPADVEAINARLRQTNYSGLPVTSGVYANPVNTTQWLAKLDHQASSRSQIGLRYSQYDAASNNSRGAGGLSAPSASAGLDNVDRGVALSHTWSLSSSAVNETRAQVTFSDLDAPPADQAGPSVAIAGVATFGRLSAAPTARENRLVEIADNISRQAGAHALRAGVDLLYNDDTIVFPRSSRGAYTFSSLVNFLAGTYNNAGFSQTFGIDRVRQTNPNVGVFAQDEWKATPTLTMNTGLRYDLQFLETIRTDVNNLAPRMGLAWSPGGDGRTVLRGNAGLFFDRVPLRPLANALLSAGNTTDLTNLRQTIVTLSPGQAGAPAFPNTLDAPLPSVTLPNLTTMDSRLQNASSRQASVELQRQFGRGGTVSISYQYVGGRGLLASINQNVPSCVAAAGNNGCRPIPEYGNNSQYSSVGSSRYQGLQLDLVQRPNRWGSLRASYTFSKSLDDVGQFFFSSPIDPFDIAKDWARSDNDRRHQVVVNTSVYSPNAPARTFWARVSHGFEASVLLHYASSAPLNITSGATTIQGTTGRPIVDGAFIERNAGTGPDFFSIDLRVSRSIRLGPHARLEALIEGFNVTNRTNALALNGNFGTGTYPLQPAPRFGEITAVGESRAFQIAARLRLQ
jgi:hypothetical protein